VADNIRSGPLVLVVDDAPEVRSLLESFLVAEGFQVAEAADGEEATEKAIRLRPAVILLDFAMPKMDGWNCARRLREDPRTARMPIIAVTAHTTQQDRNRAMYSGVDGFVGKPFELEAVLAEIHRVLAIR
jgi:CheY-like chemotaxis protein